MRVYWWQDGLHFEPTSDKERQTLADLLGALQAADFGHGVLAGPTGIVQADDQEAVVGIHEGPEVIP